MRKYELMTVFTVEEDAFKTGMEKLRSVLDDHQAKIVSEESYGDKTLAYPIEKKQKGRYTLFNLELEPEKVALIRRQLKLIHSMLTFLFIRVEE